MNPTKDEQILIKHFKDLANAAYQKGIPMYSDFLSLNEINLFYNLQSTLIVDSYLEGGYNAAERNIVCFYDKDSSHIKPSPPISCIVISPLNKKFSDSLNHRDFLGAILNLGLERSKIGDIIISSNVGYLFCTNQITDFIIDNLIRIKHTSITCELIDYLPIEANIAYKEIIGTVASERLDAVISLAFSSSRSSLLSYITSGKVFVNGKLIQNISFILKTDDIISVRGYGKFIYKGLLGRTKKDRCSIKIQKYI